MNTNSTSAAWLSRLLKAAAALTMAASAVAFAPLAHAQAGTVTLTNCSSTNTAMTGFAWNGSSLSVTCSSGPPIVIPPPVLDPLAGTFRLSAATGTVNGGATDTVYVERIIGWLNPYTIAYSITATGNASANPSSGFVSFGDKDGASRPIAINTGTGGGTLTVTLGAVTPNTTTAAGVYTLTVNGAPAPPVGGGDWKTDAATPQVTCATAANYYDFFKASGQKSQFTLKGGESGAVAFIANGGTQPALSSTETINTPGFADNQIVVSQCPGDFTPAFPCMQSFTSTGGTLAANSGVAQPSYMQGAYCQLVPGNKYYLNIRQVVRGTSTPSCPTSTNPQGCEVRGQVQGLF